MLSDVMLTARTANHEQPGWGVAGGEGPPVCVTMINPDGADAIELAALDTREIAAGTVVRLQQTGGSGYGDPFERDAARVLRDVLDGYLSAGAAQDKYGVEIVEGRVDKAATALRRKR